VLRRGERPFARRFGFRHGRCLLWCGHRLNNADARLGPTEIFKWLFGLLLRFANFVDFFRSENWSWDKLAGSSCLNLTGQVNFIYVIGFFDLFFF